MLSQRPSPCSAAGLFKSMALGALARRAEHLPGLLSELRPHLKRLLVGQNETLQAAMLALLEALLPKEPDNEAGKCHCAPLSMALAWAVKRVIMMLHAAHRSPYTSSRDLLRIDTGAD